MKNDGGDLFSIEVFGETLELRADRAVYLPHVKTLCLSDVHLGKAESLQGLGLPIPSGDHMVDLGRIAKLIRHSKAERVFILGDLIHQKRGMTEEIMETLGKFLKFLSSVRFELLLGNHERGAIKLLSQLPIQIHEGDLQEGTLRFSHGHEAGFEPSGAQVPDLLTIQGHIHPVVMIREGSTKLRLPCFWLRENTLTLPAFGSMTGGWVVKKNRRDRIIATTGSKLFEVP